MNSILHLLKGERIIARPQPEPAQPEPEPVPVECEFCDGHGFAYRVNEHGVHPVSCPVCFGLGWVYIAAEARHA